MSGEAAKPADIPQDVWDAAFKAYIDRVEAEGCDIAKDPTEHELLVVVSRAIKAERTRCRRIAHLHGKRHPDDEAVATACIEIVRAILTGEAPVP